MLRFTGVLAIHGLGLAGSSAAVGDGSWPPSPDLRLTRFGLIRPDSDPPPPKSTPIPLGVLGSTFSDEIAGVMKNRSLIHLNELFGENRNP
jgi:hypothetical protein